MRLVAALSIVDLSLLLACHVQNTHHLGLPVHDRCLEDFQDLAMLSAKMAFIEFGKMLKDI